MDLAQLDKILELQLAVAWAGEASTDPPRLRWWRTAMNDEFQGEDLFRRLAPKTWRWAALESARQAAKRVDDRHRRAADDADHLLSLFRLGFEIDEQLDDRLRQLKQSEVPPSEVFPDLTELMSEWSPDRFGTWLATHTESKFTATATGRRLQGEKPTQPSEVAEKLVAALRPLADEYPLPYFRTAR